MKHNRPNHQVSIDEVLLDATNVNDLDHERFEGKRETKIPKRNVRLVWVVFLCVGAGFLYQLIELQIVSGAEFRTIAENNQVDEAVIIAERGVVVDRNGEPMIWNERDETGEYDFPIRAYTDRAGLGQVLGYVSYPKRDSSGVFFRTEYVGRNGVEAAYEDVLRGTNGTKLIEVDAKQAVVSEHAIAAPTPGGQLQLSIDAELSEAMYDIIATSSAAAGFRSGAGAIMNVHTGELIALTSFPSYDPEVMADGDDVALINEYNNDERLPFLNKVIGGAYTPGSIVKPFVAYAALRERVLSEDTQMYSNGTLVIPNRYNPSNPSYFNDWRSHGQMTVREAIAYSSNIYFYVAGGGLPDYAAPQAGLQSGIPGLGITKMAEHYRAFGLGTTTGINLAQEQAGVVPDPAWKRATFDDDWRLGDTYFTAIGQFGFLTTPIQMLRAYSALASGGTLVRPHVNIGQILETETVELDPAIVQIVHEGMRKTVNFPGGTARALERDDVAIAAKSGTAEIGAGNAYVNSWAAGFWPYEEPQYAFILMMDRAPRSNSLGATRIMGDVVEWMSEYRPEYLSINAATTTETIATIE
jgi:penicillin-binding protein 2